MQLAGKKIGQYEIIDVLGSGGMATVYRAKQLNIEREVAIKIMADAFARQPDFVERFKREAALFAQLEHPHILPIYDYGDSDGYLYLVLRMMEGGSLESQVRKKALSLEQISKVFQQVSQALDHAHRREVIHRDLKPNNILLDKFFNAYLMDFGIAKILSEARLTATGTLLGTPAYMAPEMWKLELIDGRADIYSLGLMLYEILVGDLPFQGESPFQYMYAHLHEMVPAVSDKVAGYTQQMDEVIFKSTAKDPDDRYDTATEMANEFAKAVKSSTTSELPTTKKRSTSEKLGKIFVVLEHSSSGLSAIPSLDDFVQQTHKADTIASKSTSAIDDIFGTLESDPDQPKINTQRVDAILSQGKMNEVTLGVSAQPIQLPSQLASDLNQNGGLLVIGVEPDSAAEKGGMHIGDILVKLNNLMITNQDALRNLLKSTPVGEPVDVIVVRAGQVITVSVTLEAPSA